MARLSRRRFIALTTAGLGAGAVAAWVPLRDRSEVLDRVAGGTDTPTPTPALAAASSGSATLPTPTPIPEPPVMPRGRETVTLLPGTEWEASGVIFHSGRPGPRLMVLGGVHGNEPGGWMAAEQIAGWEVEHGMLIVLPRVNHRSAAAFQRTLDGFGDLNRLYPGDPEGMPMARMAAAIVELARAWRPHWLFDLHESWGFYNERGANGGTAFIGQTVTSSGPAPALDLVADVTAEVNAQITAREQLTVRNRPGGRFGGGGAFGDQSDLGALSGVVRRGTSSLSLGTVIPGLNPVLVEMGQQDQSEWRRAELHQLLVRTMITRLEMA